MQSVRNQEQLQQQQQLKELERTYRMIKNQSDGHQARTSKVQQRCDDLLMQYKALHQELSQMRETDQEYAKQLEAVQSEIKSVKNMDNRRIEYLDQCLDYADDHDLLHEEDVRAETLLEIVHTHRWKELGGTAKCDSIPNFKVYDPNGFTIISTSTEA